MPARKRLSLEIAREIRLAKKPGCWTRTANELARKYGVSSFTIMNVWRNKIYVE